MPRRLSEEATRKQFTYHSTGSGHCPQSEKVGWYLRDYSSLNLLGGRFERFVSETIKTKQVHILRMVQIVFLQKRHLETADLYEPPLDMFGAEAVERWFTDKEIEQIVELENGLRSHPGG